MVAIGTYTRLAPVVASPKSLHWSYPTEDGYLMMTIARNLSAGHGLSVSHGEVATNGVQPLFTAIQALIFAMADGQRDPALLAIMVLSVVIGLGAMAVVFAVIDRTLRPGHSAVSLFAASAWYAAPVTIQHSMNGLETGLYTPLAWLTVLSMSKLAGDGAAVGRKQLIPSVVILSLAIWARVDAVLLILAMLVAACVLAARTGSGHPVRRVATATVASLILVSPWALMSWLRFGSVLPISGRAQALAIQPAVALREIASKLGEYCLVILPVPGRFEMQPVVVIGSYILVIIAAASGLFHFRRSSSTGSRFVILTGAVFALLMSLYCVFGSSAYHFFSRYLFPASIIFAVMATATARLISARMSTVLSSATCIAFVLIVAAGNIHLLHKIDDNNYRPLVDWAAAHVSDDTWIGAPQSGTLGFYHDRTVNLDGKVDPEALRALLDGDLGSYVSSFEVDGRVIEYLIGWYDLPSWIELHGLERFFQPYDADSDDNICVYIRRPEVVRAEADLGPGPGRTFVGSWMLED